MAATKASRTTPPSCSRNAPFRLFKHWVHEGGSATPLVAHWPAGIRARGELTDAVGHVIDFMPTCLELAGADYPTEFGGNAIHAMEGESLLPVLRGDSFAQPRTIYWEHMGNKAIRAGDWKLVTHRHTDDWKLYNLLEDRTELDNRIANEPVLAEAMTSDWRAWSGRIEV